MKMFKRILGILLSAVLSLSLFAGCGGTEPYDPENFLPNGTETNPYQIVKEKVTIDVFVPTSGSATTAYDDMSMFEVLQEVTNIDLRFNEVESSSYTNVRSAVWEDKKNLPDLFLFSNPISEQVVYSGYGALVPFNDDDLVVSGVAVGNVIENYMPTYKALLDNNFNIQTTSNAKKVATLADGKMYCTLSAKDVPRDLSFKMWINQQWIDNLQEDEITMPNGSAVPDADDIETVEQYIDILRLFKNNDVNRNGDPNDEIPVSSQELNYLRNFILASYGYVMDSIEVENDGSEVTFVPYTEAYKKYMETMRTIYSEGLIAQDTFSLKTDAQLQLNGLEGRLGSFPAAAAYLIVGVDKDSQYTTFGPLNSAFYTGTPLQWGFNNFSPTGAVIPTGTPYVREIARLLDIMYSELGCQLLAYGKEDVDWKWDDEEKTTWSYLIPDGFEGTSEDYRSTLTPNYGLGAGLYWSYDFVGKTSDEVTSRLNTLSERYVPYLKEPFPSEIKLTGSQYNTVEVITAGLTPYIANMEYNFITGAKSIETDWSAFMSNLEQYRVSELIDIYDGAFQAYKQNA